MVKVATEQDNWLIQPKDIAIPEKSGSPLPEAFGCLEMEIDAARIIRFCKVGGRWRAFTVQEIRAHSLADEKTTRLGVFDFGHHVSPIGGSVSLLIGGFVVRDTMSGKCRVTDIFIERCYKASRGEKVEIPAAAAETPAEPKPTVPAETGRVIPGIWRNHNGSTCRVIGVAQHLITGERFVVYRSLAHEGDSVLMTQPEADFTEEIYFSHYHGPRFVLVEADD